MLIRILIGALYAALGFVSWSSQLSSFVYILMGSLYGSTGLIALVIVTIFAERKNIGATNKELLAYCFTFPLFIFSYIPISFLAIFSKSEWKPIHHTGGIKKD
jgi:hypothetical protein